MFAQRGETAGNDEGPCSGVVWPWAAILDPGRWPLEAEMKPCAEVGCSLFPCLDVRRDAYVVPDLEVDPDRISLLLVAEASPPDPADHYYAPGAPLFGRTTLLAFQDAGLGVESIAGLIAHGIYLTTSVKCGKTGYAISTPTVAECSKLLEREIELFPRARAILLMGDVAIKAMNAVASRAEGKRAIPAGPTWKLRGGEYEYRGRRLFPSYLQAGPAFFIEKSKRRMIAEDIAAALAFTAG
jgi:hypothetical protein